MHEARDILAVEFSTDLVKLGLLKLKQFQSGVPPADLERIREWLRSLGKKETSPYYNPHGRNGSLLRGRQEGFGSKQAFHPFNCFGSSPYNSKLSLNYAYKDPARFKSVPRRQMLGQVDLAHINTNSGALQTLASNDYTPLEKIAVKSTSRPQVSRNFTNVGTQVGKAYTRPHNQSTQTQYKLQPLE